MESEIEVGYRRLLGAAAVRRRATSRWKPRLLSKWLRDRLRTTVEAS